MYNANKPGNILLQFFDIYLYIFYICNKRRLLSSSCNFEILSIDASFVILPSTLKYFYLIVNIIFLPTSLLLYLLYYICTFFFIFVPTSLFLYLLYYICSHILYFIRTYFIIFVPTLLFLYLLYYIRTYFIIFVPTSLFLYQLY